MEREAGVTNLSLMQNVELNESADYIFRGRPLKKRTIEINVQTRLFDVSVFNVWSNRGRMRWDGLRGG
jgi:hypothetical protein